MNKQEAQLEAMRVAKMIETIINTLKTEGIKSQDLIQAKAQTMANYDKHIGIKSAEMKAEGLAVTSIPAQAKSECSEMLYDKIVAEEGLKAHYSRMDTLKAQLNGYQSINRHLDVM